MHHNVLLKCIDQTLKLYSKLNSKDFVGYESGAGYVPGDPRDPVGVRLIRHLISVLTRLVLNVNGVVLKHTDDLLNSIVYLFMGGNGRHDNNMEGVRNLAKPLVEKIFSEMGIDMSNVLITQEEQTETRLQKLQKIRRLQKYLEIIFRLNHIETLHIKLNIE